MASFYPTRNQNTYILSSGAQTGAETGYAITHRINGKIWVGRATETQRIYANEVGSCPLNQWSHVAGVYDAGTEKLKVYINGELIGEYTGNSHQGEDNLPRLEIGKPNNTRAAYFFGTIEEVRVYDRALSQEEIQSVYSAMF